MFVFLESEDVNKVSKMQKIFAKKSIKREKRKEKDHRKKVEKSKFKLIWTNLPINMINTIRMMLISLLQISEITRFNMSSIPFILQKVL